MLDYKINLSYKYVTTFLLGLLLFGSMSLFFNTENSSAQVVLTLDATELFNNTGPGATPSANNNDIDYNDVDAMGIADVRLRKISGTCMDNCGGGGCSGNCGNSSDIWGEPAPGAPFPQEEGAWFGCASCPAPGANGNAVRTETYQIDILETGTNNLLPVDSVLLRFNGINNNVNGLEEFGGFQIFDNTGFNVTGSTNFMHTSIHTNPPVAGMCGGGTTFDPLPNNDLKGVFPSGCDDGAFLELSVTNGTLSSIRFTRSDINNIVPVSPPCCFNESEGSYLGLVQLTFDERIPPPTPTPTPTEPGATPTPVPPGSGPGGPTSVPALDILGIVGLGGALLLAAIFMLHRRRRIKLN
ncbi:MAG: hypothetical protein DHS20C13_00010 [Thermodesulfobacteriota bacterium]|nr:MAG: hypothetical protein DHS20C13_00010 [Thermodesulfobacteriota bacterium]